MPTCARRIIKDVVKTSCILDEKESYNVFKLSFKHHEQPTASPIILPPGVVLSNSDTFFVF